MPSLGIFLLGNSYERNDAVNGPPDGGLNAPGLGTFDHEGWAKSGCRERLMSDDHPGLSSLLSDACARARNHVRGGPMDFHCWPGRSEARFPRRGATIPSGHRHVFLRWRPNGDGNNLRSRAAGPVGASVEPRRGSAVRDDLAHVAVGDRDPTGIFVPLDRHQWCRSEVSLGSCDP
jgi:hypothetical protein